MRIAIIGMGEIGKALLEVLRNKFPETPIFIKDLDKKKPVKVDYLHICYPYNWEFKDLTNEYVRQYQPKLTLVHTTTVIGTTRKIIGQAVHAPLRGRHDNLVDGIRTYPIFFGYDDIYAMEDALKYMSQWNAKPYPVFATEASELAKLLSLTQYAFNIEFARYAARCCKAYNVDYDDVVSKYTETYNRTIGILEGPEYYKPKLTPPDGKIGGHCVLPAVEKLNAQVPNEILKEILRVNKEA
jgi:hypothetical protein|tara:strand:- start:866 stop:1588 length:723 start_codon:yes stop_codon:yes gene_type:complete